MSMGRISSDRADVATGGAGEDVVVGGASAGVTIGMSSGATTTAAAAPPLKDGTAASNTASTDVPEGTPVKRHGLGHRRVPSDGVAWRRSKGMF